jgi:hypothetical protein
MLDHLLYLLLDLGKAEGCRSLHGRELDCGFVFLKVTVSHFGLCVFFQGNYLRDEAAIGERCADGRQEVGSEPRLNDIAVPARIECGPGLDSCYEVGPC